MEALDVGQLDDVGLWCLGQIPQALINSSGIFGFA